MVASNTAGTVKAPGLPNITGTFHARAYQSWPSTSGAFSADRISTDVNQDGGNASNNTYTFNASRSNAIYGAADTVQPPAVTVRFIIKY